MSFVKSSHITCAWYNQCHINHLVQIMGLELDKDEVLGRPDLDITQVIEPKHLQTEGEHSSNQFWIGGKCYIPVVYMGQSFRLQVQIKTHEG